MCGIAGILKVHPPTPPGGSPPPPEVAIPEAWLDILDGSIKHRGPDGRGRFRDRAVRPDGSMVDVALVHRRLAIIDPACGAQPMVQGGGGFLSREGGPYRAERSHVCPRCGPGTVAVVFNGCIYNHRELRRELEAAGHVFETDHSDTEVLIHGWRAWGGEVAERLEGMHAFLIWDGQRGEVHVGRDLFGKKPLYIAGPHGASCAWGSTAAGLHRLNAVRGIEEQTDIGWLSAWLGFGYASRSPLGCGAADRPVRVAEVRQGLATIRATKDFGIVVHEPTNSALDRLIGASGPRRNDLTPAECERLLSAAVGARLEADVPRGCFLSGGVDSSLIAAFARERLGCLRTFTVRMPNDRYDESGFAARVAAHLGTTHTTVECHPHPADDLATLIEQLGLPFGDSSLLPTYWVCRAARSETAVALSGDGGDELFLGYERYTAADLLKRWGWLLALMPERLLPQADPKSAWSKLARLKRAGARGYVDLMRVFSAEQMGELLHGGAMHRADRSLDVPRAVSMEEAVAWDVREYLPGDLLRKADTASMAIALEVRSPFLDRNVAAAALGATTRSLAPNGQRKGLLRQVARKYLPAEIVDRPKMGFAIPVGEWFRTDYGGMRTLLMDHLESAEPFPGVPLEINMPFVRRMIDEHMGQKRDHSQRLYMLLVLSIWARWVAGISGGGRSPIP